MSNLSTASSFPCKSRIELFALDTLIVLLLVTWMHLSSVRAVSPTNLSPHLTITSKLCHVGRHASTCIYKVIRGPISPGTHRAHIRSGVFGQKTRRGLWPEYTSRPFAENLLPTYHLRRKKSTKIKKLSYHDC